MCLVRDEKTVGALQGVWIGLNIFYAGFVFLPQNFLSVFRAGLWINASRFALEGIVFSQFEEIPTLVVASDYSPFWYFLGCNQNGNEDVGAELCSGSMIKYATFFFGDKFSAANRSIDVGALCGWIFLGLFGTWFCLKKFNYVNT